MGCSNSTPSVADTSEMAAPAVAAKGSAKASNKCEQKYPASEAFIIPLDDANVAPAFPDTKVVPPKRIQKLLGQAATEQPLTIKDLEEKLNKADLRRKEYMQQKIDNIQKTAQLLQHNKDHADKYNQNEQYAEEIGAHTLDDDRKHNRLTSLVKV